MSQEYKAGQEKAAVEPNKSTANVKAVNFFDMFFSIWK